MPRLGRAAVVAPLAAPLTLVVGSVVRALVSPRTAPEAINPVAGFLFLTAIVVAYGAPLAYGATVVIVWPAAAVLRQAKAFTWWALTLVSALAGGSLFPVYLRALDSRATWDFFPGAGFAAGAATGWVFWFIATRRGSAGS
jgi:hypothetical protein